MITSPEGSHIDRSTLLEMYRKMALIRACDTRLIAEIKAGKFVCGYYSPRGQEAIAGAMAVNLRPDDYLVTIYRGLHDQLAKGIPLRELWAEYAGRVDGSCKGKGGPMHITHPDSGIMVTTGIVGSGIVIANGFAWASQLDGNDRVTVTNFGDGASNIGAFHEALNMAGVWKLPVVFVCQNNLYSEHTKYAYGTAVDSVAKRAQGYGMPGVQVNGNDPIAAWAAMRDAVTRARRGEGPTLIEAMTFRFNGHNLGDPAEYIPPEEVTAALANDPVPALRSALLEWKFATESELQKTEERIAADIQDAVEFALASGHPPLEELGRDVYSEEVV